VQRETIYRQFERLNPKGAALLSLVEVQGLRPCFTKEGERNLIDERRKEHFPVHDTSSALKEGKEWAARFLRSDIDYLIVFGLGLGWHLKALEPWLREKQSRRLIVLEDDLAIISCFLETELAQELFLDSQSTLFYIDEGQEGKEVLETIAWNLYRKNFSVLASPFYQRLRSPFFEELQRYLVVQKTDVETVLDEFFAFGPSQLSNFARNLLLWPKSKNGSSLFGHFKNIPAIVTAAGPSLEKALPLLQNLSSKALILSGGSSTNALLQGGVLPHFALSVDPNPMQYLRLRQTQPFCLPLFYRSRTLYDGLMQSTGPLLYLRGADGYPIVEWFEKELGVKGKIVEGGHSVSNLLIELAYSLGCRPIIMVGYDLAYSQGARYASSLSESLSTKEKLSFKGSREAIKAPGYQGKEVVTEPKWVVEGRWIESFQSLYPRLQLIQTTEEGLFLEGIKAMPFPTVVESLLGSTHEIDSLVHLALEEAKPLHFSDEELTKVVREMAESITMVQKELEELLQIFSRLKSQEIADSHEVSERFERVEATLAFQWALKPFFMMSRKFWALKERLECRPLLDEDKLLSFRGQALQEQCFFLLEACRAHEKFLFSLTAWASLHGHFLKGALSFTPPFDLTPPNMGETV
jgi:hypothetical protein